MLNTEMIGSKIAEARKKNNLSQIQLAERMFISAQAVGKWERGESMPDIVTFNRLAEILGVDLNYFSAGFQSADTESGESPDKRPAETTSGEHSQQTGKAEEKSGWDMSLGNWIDADFSGLKNLHERFSSSNMQRCKFNGSSLAGLLLKNNNVDSCDFSGSDISNSHIKRSNLVNNLFKNSSLKKTDVLESNVDRCDFSGANFSGTKFSKSYICGCDFTGADLTGMVIKSGGFTGVKSRDTSENTIVKAVWNCTSFIDTQIADMVFTGNLEDCYFENCRFTRVIFRNVTLVNTFFKNNRNLKRVQFIDCRADRITYEFLKQGNADLTGIRLLT